MELPADVRTIAAAEVEVVPGPAGLLGHGALGEVRAGRWRVAPGPRAAAGDGEVGTTAVALKQLFYMREDAESIAAIGGALSPVEQRAVVAGFLRECTILSRAHHPNILPFYGIVYAPGAGGAPQLLYMATAHAASGSLRDLCHKPRYASLRPGAGPALSFAVTVDVLLDLFMALEYLHSRAQPVLHRDVKPANVLVEIAGGNGAL